MYSNNASVMGYSPNARHHKPGAGYAPNQAVKIPDDAEEMKMRFQKTFHDDTGRSGYWIVAFSGDTGYDAMNGKPIILDSDAMEVLLPHGSNNAKRGADPLKFRYISDLAKQG